MRPTQEMLSESVEIVNLTPELAEELLLTNKMNRKIREDWVAYLAGEMKAGRWHINGDTIVVDENDILADGQHRCLATIMAKFSYPAILVRQVGPDARLTIDDPMRRTFADDLVMNGQGPNANLREAVLRKIITWNRDKGLGYGSGRIKISRARLAVEYPQYSEAIANAMALAQRHRKSILGPSIGAFVAWLLLANAPEAVVDRFFSILAIGSQDPEDYPAVLLRDKIQVLKSDPLAVNNTTAMIIYWTIQGWNNWLTGERTTRLVLPKGRKLSNPFPQPAVVK